jgi:small subunit ribosomal protein S2
VVAPEDSGQEETLAPLDLRSLFVAGVHFGHPSKRWNPKMAQYIFGKRSRAHIIDLSQTVTMLKTAKDVVEEIVAKGGECLMVGTKAQAQGAIKEQANRAGAMYINQRWLGGMMTNFQTIQARIERLVYLEDAFAKDTIVAQTKRESLMLASEVERLNKFFGGIKEMEKLPQILFIVDIEKENIAVAEARRLGIPIVAIVDTNCDPTQVDFAIPGNDDSVRSITLIAQHIAEAIANGKVAAQKASEERMAAEAELEAQEAAARAEAQAKAAERAAAAAQEKTASDAVKAAEAKKAEAAAPSKPKTESQPPAGATAAKGESGAEVTKDEAKTAPQEAKEPGKVEAPKAPETPQAKKEDTKPKEAVAAVEASTESPADTVETPVAASEDVKVEKKPAASKKPAPKAKPKAETKAKTGARAAGDDKKTEAAASKIAEASKSSDSPESAASKADDSK